MDEAEIKIVKLMQTGQEEAFAYLFDKYQGKLFRMAYLISASYADSEDIVQETMIKCFRYRDKLKDPLCFESWLYQILTRTAWRFCRNRRAESPVEQIWDEEQPDSGPLPLEEIMESDMSRQLYQAVCELDLKQRTVVILYYYNQLSTREIARITGSLEGTVKSRLFTARRNLKKIWKESQTEGETPYGKRTVRE